MATEHTGTGDPDATIALLWRETTDRPRPGPQPARSVDDVVVAATEIADADGLDAVTIRTVARRLSIAPMTVYTHVPGKAELLDCMLDDAYRRMQRTDTAGQRWRVRVAAVADDNRRLGRAHPWTVTIATGRPPLGPGQLAKYEHELAAFDDTDIDDTTRDTALTFVLDFVRITMLAELEHGAGRTATGLDDRQWWETTGLRLARHIDPTAYPRASRIGTTAGDTRSAPRDTDHAYRFGLERILDGLAPVLEPAPRPHSNRR